MLYYLQSVFTEAERRFQCASTSCCALTLLFEKTTIFLITDCKASMKHKMPLN